MQTDDADKLFQTEASVVKEASRRVKAVLAKKIGDPIECPSKVLQLVVRGQDAWTAESGWVAKRIDLRTGKTRKIFKGHNGPCTCIAFLDSKSPSQPNILFTGSWDKSIKAWNSETGELLSTNQGHTDFTKTLLVIPHLNLVLSGSSDKRLLIWDASSFHTPTSSSSEPPTLKLVGSSKRHTRPIECFVLDPQASENGPNSAVLFSGDSMGVIFRWKVTRQKVEGGEDKVVIQELGELVGHKTSVPEMVIGEGGLWSASVDNTVLFHPLPPSDPPVPPTSIPHPYYVKCLTLLPTTFNPAFPILLTGSTDEHIRVFDVSPILENALSESSAGSSSMLSEEIVKGRTTGKGKAKEIARVEGHYHEVTGIKPWIKITEDGKKEAWVVSAGLDASIRRWSMQDILHPKVVPETEEKEKEEVKTMTEEEERELAELMDED